jgi:hypothetical protein
MKRVVMAAIALCAFPPVASAAEFTSKPYDGATVTAESLSWTFRSTAPAGDEGNGVAYQLSSENLWHGCLYSPHEVVLDHVGVGTYTITIADDYTQAWLVSKGLALEASRLCDLPGEVGFVSDSVTVTRDEGPPVPVNTPAPYKDEGPPWTARSDEEASTRMVAESESQRRAQEERAHPPASVVAPAPVVPTPCVVPALLHHSLAAARRLLAAAYCRLGRVTAPHRRRGTLVVTHQSPSHGQTVTPNAAVTVDLGHVKRR